MRVFMLGWEFPPHISGGLGTACYGMTKGLSDIGVEVCFVLPTAIPVSGPSHVQLRSLADASRIVRQRVSKALKHVEVHQVGAVLQPYGNEASYREAMKLLEEHRLHEFLEDAGSPLHALSTPGAAKGTSTIGGAGGMYHGNLMDEVHRYARMAVEIARNEEFQVIHAHDWMTFPAGLAVAAATGRPLIVHVHSTEFDRSGQNVNQQVYDVERAGVHGADKVVCVSYLTRSIVVSRYGVPAHRVAVVHNAVDLPEDEQFQMKPIGRDEKIVLFLGRVTMQKGPEYFLQAARKVVDKYPKVRFIMAGSGDMIAQCIRLAADLKLGRYVTFTGFLRGGDVDRVFRMADLYVMPSVSEPFGIAPLEAISRNVPVIISKQSGVGEVLNHVLKVDFWDVEEMANKILAVLRHAPLQKTLRQHGAIELRKLSWRDSATQLNALYTELTAAGA
ncbi:MAG TPA: glycosyltransferase [Phycisphaerae bacterium]|nr:glycosyltransferase [Phycisphaerae bacterium]